MRYGWTIDGSDLAAALGPRWSSLNWKQLPFPFEASPVEAAMIPASVVGVYMVSCQLGSFGTDPSRPTRLDCVLYVGRGSIRNRYVAHCTARTKPRLLSALRCYRGYGEFVFRYAVAEGAAQCELEDALIRAIGPVGNTLNGCRLRSDVPAG